MKKLLYIFAAALLLCACGTKQTQQQCPYSEDSFPIHGAVLRNADSIEYYRTMAAQGDARAQYVMSASYYCADQAQPIPLNVNRVRSRAEADSLLDAAANQGYKPAIKTRECFRECRE